MNTYVCYHLEIQIKSMPYRTDLLIMAGFDSLKLRFEINHFIANLVRVAVLKHKLSSNSGNLVLISRLLVNIFNQFYVYQI